MPTWTNDIKKMFTTDDIKHMKSRFDLSSYQSVKANAQTIYNALNWIPPPDPPQVGVNYPVMPPSYFTEPPWTQDMLNTFKAWIQQGCPQ